MSEELSREQLEAWRDESMQRGPATVLPVNAKHYAALCDIALRYLDLRDQATIRTDNTEVIQRLEAQVKAADGLAVSVERYITAEAAASLEGCFAALSWDEMRRVLAAYAKAKEGGRG